MSPFKQLKCDDNLKEIIKSAFGSDFDLSGDWGYTQDLSTIIHSAEIPIAQLEHILASMRAYIEMNMTLLKEDRFGGIDLNEIERVQVSKDQLVFDKVTYEITAMQEDIYTKFIKAYKEGYGKKGFNLAEHFNQRKKATLIRRETYWFEIHQTLHLPLSQK